MEKSLYAAPLGMDQEPEMPDIEIEIEIPAGLEALEIDILEDKKEEFDQHIAEVLDEKILTEIAGELLADFEDDVSARKDWIQTYVDGL